MSSSDSRTTPHAVMSSRVWLRVSPSMERVSQVPGRPVRTRRPLSPREARQAHTLIASLATTDFTLSGRLADLQYSVTRLNRVRLRYGSCVRRTGLRPRDCSHSPADYLHGERASTMLTTFQVKRSAKLSLTHQRHEGTKKTKDFVLIVSEPCFVTFVSLCLSGEKTNAGTAEPDEFSPAGPVV